MQGCWRLHQDTLSAAQMQLQVCEPLKYLLITEMCTTVYNCAYLMWKTVNTTKDNSVVAERQKK